MGKSKKHHRHQNSTASPPLTKKHHAVHTSSTTTARSPRPPPRRSSSYYSRPAQTAASDTLLKSPGNRFRHTKSCDTEHVIKNNGSFSPEFRSDQILIPDESLDGSSHSPCRCISSKATTFTPSLQGLDLRPIITKPVHKRTTMQKTAVSSPLRMRSLRISTRKSVSSGARRRSRAVVKASVDPMRDFKESMEEMIAENKIREPKELEELLACYLCLNSQEYHNIIINVFKQIWIDLN